MSGTDMEISLWLGFGTGQGSGSLGTEEGAGDKVKIRDRHRGPELRWKEALGDRDVGRLWTRIRERE